MSGPCVIVGAGHAAAQLCASLVQSGWDRDIILIGEESWLPYHRPPLSKTALNPEAEDFPQWIRPDSFYRDHSVQVITGERVERIDRSRRTVHTATREFSYGKLVLCTGSIHRELPIPGLESGRNAGRVFALRTFADAMALRRAAAGAKQMVVLGAGYIGMEVAASLRGAGTAVTVLEREERVLSRVTSPEVSAFFDKLHRLKGVNLHLNVKVQAVEETASGLQVKDADGEVFDCDLLVTGTGALANSGLALDAGLPVEEGIIVDAACRTADPDIFAIGDCSLQIHPIYQRSLRLESVQNAVDQAKTAAAALCGKPLPPPTIPWFWSDQYDVKLQTVGLAAGVDRTVVRGTPEPGNSFSVWYFSGTRLLAADAVNDSVAYAVASKCLKAGRSPDPDLLDTPMLPLKEILKLTMEN